MSANNQGIVHLITGTASDGWMPPQIACRKRNAHIAVTSDRFSAEPRKCKRCEAQWIKRQEKRAAKTA